MRIRISAVTLIELIIAIVLLSVVVLGFSSLDLFSRYHVLTADRRAKVQNEVSLALEHMTKQISRAIGNKAINSDDVVNTSISNRIVVYIDANNNGVRNDIGVTGDARIAYRLNSNQLEYCSNCGADVSCATCSGGWGSAEVISNNISSFTPTPPGALDNYVDVELQGCWDADGVPFACGLPDNPTVTMRTRIKMPSVSTN